MMNSKNFKHIFWAVCCLFISFFKVTAQNKNLYKNKNFHFSIKIPANWHSEEHGNDSTQITVTLINNNDSSQVIYLFAYKIDGKIDLERFAEQDTILFSNLGKLSDSKSHFKLLIFLLNSVEKSYFNEKLYTKLLFKSEANFGYVVMWKGLSNDYIMFKNICDSLEIEVPMMNVLKVLTIDTFKGIGGWIIGIIGLIFFLGTCYFLGLSGVDIRKHIMIVNETQRMIANKSNEVQIQTLSKIRTKSTYRIIGMVFLISVFYCGVFALTELKTFLIFLLILVPVIMGYFGIFFTLSEDIDDYF